MVTWISLGVIVFALIVLALAVRPVLARLPFLGRALRRLQQRQEQAEALQAAATELQERALELQEAAGAAQQHLALIKDRRDG